MRVIKSLTACCVGVCCSLFFASSTWGVELTTNGGFESGDLTNWMLTDEGSGTFLVTSGTTPPGNGLFEAVGPASGAFYAVSGQGGPGTHAIAQEFEVPSKALSVTLSYDMFVQTGATQTVDPIGLDHTGPSNQHARVDILSPGADPLDTNLGVLQNFYLGIDGQPPQDYQSYSHDITDLVGDGGVFVLRFAQTDNLGNFNQGVDNVSIDFVPIPEPSALVLALLAVCAGTWQRMPFEV